MASFVELAFWSSWKLVSSIIDKRLKTTIRFHEALHGFRSQRGTGTATLEAKLQMQLAHLQRETLFQIFLDLSKAYDTRLDRERTLEILEVYGVGPNTIQLLRTFWSKQLAVARQSGYHSRAFRVARGVTQGDVISPTIFNVVVDAIVFHWFQTIQNKSIDTASLTVQARFYADDGLIASRDH